MELGFGNSKTDPIWDNAKHPWHLFASPDNTVMCPVFALSMYFGYCFNKLKSGDCSLLPGHIQHGHLCNLMEEILHEHEEGLHELGF